VRAVTKAEPLPPIGLEIAERALGEIALRWTPNVERDLVHYELLRGSAAENGFAPERVVGQVPPDATRATDFGVGCGERVRYRLRALDVDGLESGFSETLEVKAQDAGLALERRGDQVVLSWDPARVADLSGVRVLEVRSGLPDRELAAVADGRELALPALDSGTRLAVRFQRSGGAAEPPPCLVAAP
jgi:hypothetical protein